MLEVGVKGAVLSAVTHCLAALNETTLAQYAHALFEACQGLLEAEDTPLELLVPVLRLLGQARRLHLLHSVKLHSVKCPCDGSCILVKCDGRSSCVSVQAARHTHSLQSHFRDLVDLLVGWALEPKLTPEIRLVTLPHGPHPYATCDKMVGCVAGRH